MRLYVLCAMSLAACAFEPSGPLDPGDDVGEPDPGINGDVDAANVVDPPSPDAAPSPPDAPPTPEPPTLDCRIEGDNLGIVGAKVTAGTREYTFVSWDANAAGAYTGFRLEGPAGNLRYEVRTSTDRHTGDTLVYSGNERITRVDFCVTGGD
jgi:hypothetical protein